MFSKSKLTIIAAIAATTFAAPAFAQSIDHTGTLFPSYYDASGKQVMGSWAPQAGRTRQAGRTSGLNAFAKVPAGTQAVQAAPNGYDPSINSQR